MYSWVLRVAVLFLLLSIGIGNKLPNDIRWVVKSKEYKNLTQQVYSSAWDKVSKKIKRNRKKQIAIVMDLDETVLDNSGYQLYLTDTGQSYTPATWDEWVVKEEAGLVPGAAKFISKARKKGVQFIFISNRMDSRTEETKRNMKELGVLGAGDIFLLRLDKKDTKIVRRSEVYNQTGRMKGKESYKVIAYFGDAMGDFPSDESSKFGKEFFMLPNPMYGKW